MLTDQDVLNYGLKKSLELELIILTKLRMYERISTGRTKKLIEHLAVQEASHVDKLKELINLKIATT